MIFDLFKGGSAKKPDDVKGIRETLLRFIKDELQKVEGGEGGHIRGLQLFVNCAEEEIHLYESATYKNEPERFRGEIQRIADDYALSLPQGWTFSTVFNAEVPTGAKAVPQTDATLFVQTRDQIIKQTATAYIRVLGGEAEKREYTIKSDQATVNIGRERDVQAEDGFFRHNHIAFPGSSANDANRYISRQHARIEWNNDEACFMIYADDGGVPPRNKIKIRSVGDDNFIRLNSTHIGHRLKEGDQVILGESAVIEFSYHQQDQ